MSKIIAAAKAAKAAGFIFMSSVVKSKFATTYHHVVKIDDVIAAGAWIPANFVQFESGARGRFGISTLPTKSINKSEAIRRFCK